MLYEGLYAGFVVSAADPAQIGRVKVRVPVLHGTIQSLYEVISDADLPWALPAGMPAGNSSTSGGFSHLPGPNDQVWVRYLDGELEKPVWEWGNQNLPGLQNYPAKLELHAYESDGSPTARSAWMRYNHQRIIQPAGIQDTTYGGYTYVVADSLTPTSKDGSFTWTTAAGYYMSLDDASNSMTLTVPNFYAITSQINFYAYTSMDLTSPLMNLDFGRITFVGDYSGHVIDGISRTIYGVQSLFQSFGLGALNSIVIDAPSVSISTGGIAYYPDGTPIPPANMALGTDSDGNVWLSSTGPSDGLVRLSDLQSAVSLIKQWLSTHTHGGVKGGPDISGPPVTIPIFDVSSSELVTAESFSTNYSTA